MTTAPGRLREDRAGAGLGRVPSGKDSRRVEVALDPTIRPESLPGVWLERKAKVAFALHFRDAPEHGASVLGRGFGVHVIAAV